MNEPGLVARDLSIRRPSWDAEFNLNITPGTWTSLVGPSGAGKTTLLELIAGFEVPTTGTLTLDGRNLLDVPTHRRSIAYVFQQNALFPQLTAEENLRLALHDAPITQADKRARILAMAKRVAMENRLQHRPGELSGGELARMNLARALLRPARLLLLDEPFAALDANLRRQMNGLVRELHAENSLTTLCVTHHPEDAFLFADNILVFSCGRIIGRGAPRDLVYKPANRETATLLDAGTIVTQGNEVHYVRSSQLTCNSVRRAGFTAERELVFAEWKLAETGEGTVLVCLETGRAYPLDAPEMFQGKLFYDGSSVVKF